MEVELPSDTASSRYDVGLVVLTRDRPQYLRRCFETLTRAELRGTIIAIVDDASQDEEARALIREFRPRKAPVVRIRIPPQRGGKICTNLRVGWDLLLERWQCRYLTNLDSDTLVTPDWLERVRALHDTQRSAYPTLIASGFNGALFHPAEAQHTSHVVKATQGGVNFFFERQAYDDYIRDTLDEGWDWEVGAELQQRGGRFVVTRPSVVQHIGWQGLWSRGALMSDFAVDFPGDHSPWRWLRLGLARLRGPVRRSRGRQHDPDRPHGEPTTPEPR